MLTSTRTTKSDKYGVSWEEVRLLGNKCHGCDHKFGMLEVRRHCRKCGSLFCSDCLHKEHQIVEGSSKPKPVCRSCCEKPGEGIRPVTSQDSIKQTVVSPKTCQQPEVPATEAPKKQAAGTAAHGMCFLCSKPLDKQVFVLDDEEQGERHIHLSCFKCCVDGEAIDGPYFEDVGKLYCKTHYGDLFCDRCTGCSRAIIDGTMTRALGGTWHSECFVCGVCAQPLAALVSKDAGNTTEAGNVKFYCHNGNVYCEKDYQEKCCGRCASCGFAVGDGMTAMGQLWHVECFKCQFCSKLLEGQQCLLFEGLPLCSGCSESFGGEVVANEQAMLCKKNGSKQNQGATEQQPAITAQDKGRCLAQGIRKALESAPASTSTVLSLTEASSHGATFRNSVVSAMSSAQSCGDGMVRFSFSLLDARCYKARQEWELVTAGSDGSEISFGFEAFAPEVFKNLREHAFDINEDDFKSSITDHPLTGGSQGEGKSGMLFFFSSDKRFLLKTVAPDEMPFFRKCLKDYHSFHTMECALYEEGGRSGSYLPRFLGLYTVKFRGEPAMSLVVMSNVFVPGIALKEQFDLKGVLGSKRLVDEEQQQQGVKVLKDRNFVQTRGSVRVGRKAKDALAQQLRRDVKFLEERGRIDYSVLLGIADVGVVQNPGHVRPMAECRGLQVLNQAGDLGEEVIFMGIIDILQEYNIRKALEGQFKSALHVARHLTRKSSLANADNAVSATSATHYGRRFLDFMLNALVA